MKNLISTSFALCAGIGIISPALAANYPNGESQYQPFKAGKDVFVVAKEPWVANQQGNHRAIVKVAKTDNAVVANLEWRRPDLRPETKRVIVKFASNGQAVKNVLVENLSNESAQVVFQPEFGAGEYVIYYLPYRFRPKWDDARYGSPWNDYLKPEPPADQTWADQAKADINKLPKAQVVRYETRSKFDSFSPMGLIATKAETDQILAKHSESPIIFTEDRAFPTRLFDRIPAKWVNQATFDQFKGGAMKNEYFVWQIVPWAARGELKNVKLSFSSLKNGASVIPAKEITCFNQEGINWDGKPLSFNINIAQGKLQPLWCGVQIPENAAPGLYKGLVTMTADGMEPRKIPVTIEVTDSVLKDKGDGDLWRHARLRWLNSQIGTSNKPSGTYKSIKVQDKNFIAANKEISLSSNGMLATVKNEGHSLFSQPMKFEVTTKQGKVTFNATNLSIKQTDTGLVEWNSSSTQDGIQFQLNGSLEYDGYIRYNLKVSSAENMSVDNITLVNDYTPYASRYFMGVGFDGGNRPAEWKWNWKGPFDSFWIGNEKVGMHTEYRGSAYHGPLLSDYKPAPPITWSNGGAGGMQMTTSEDSAHIEAYTGPITIGKEVKDFEWALVLTPVKKVNSAKHFSERYFHAEPEKFNEAAKEGANIANIHHARSLNPVINYPFTVRTPLVQFIKEQHAKKNKVKLYYTVRELSNYATEIYALKSLGHEIFVPGPGYGVPWHTEHLIDDYRAAWYTELPGETSDASLILAGFSRWINYYLEGLRWMCENYGIDGIYMDDVSFDRTVMKRISHIFDKYRPGALIDLHSNTGYSKGPANQYTDFFPYVDRLWFGESFLYNKMTPDEWFVRFSGIPFGLMSEMLQDGGNRYLGMVYGTTARHSYGPYSPAPVWDLWKSFGIEQAKMIGYWDEKCPVKTDVDSVKATAYVKKGKTLIALGNFSDQPQSVKLSINWKELGLSPESAKVFAPEVKDFQKAEKINLQDAITIKPKEGLLIIIEK